MLTAPAIVGAATIYASVVSGATAVLDKPTSLLDGDFLLAFLRTNGSSSPSDFALTGWTRRGYAFVPNDAAGRVFGIYSHPVSTASSEPSTFTFTKSVSDSRRVGAMVIARGVDLSNPIAGNSTGWDATPSPRVQLNSFSVDTSDPTLLVYAWANEIVSPNATAPTIIPGTEIALVPSSSDTGSTRTTIWVGWESNAATSTGHKNLTWTTATSGPSATGVVLRGLETITRTATISAAPEVSATSTVNVTRTASVGATPTVAGVITVEVSRTATVAVGASLDGARGVVSITRTGSIVASPVLSGVAVPDETVSVTASIIATPTLSSTVALQVVRSAAVTATALFEASVVVEVSRTASVVVSSDVSASVVVEVTSTATIVVAVLLAGAVEGPPVPDVRTLVEVAFVHSLTGIPVSHTLEET